MTSALLSFLSGLVLIAFYFFLLGVPSVPLA